MPADIWLPLYASDYLADGKVRALTRPQRSVLVELWCFHWRDGPLPNDLGMLCRMLGDAEPDTVQPVVAQFFTATDDGLRLVSERLHREKIRAELNIEAKKVAGRASAKSRSGNKIEHPFNDRSTTVERMPNPSPSPTPLPTTELQQQKPSRRGATKRAPVGEAPEPWLAAYFEPYAAKVGAIKPARLARAVSEPRAASPEGALKSFRVWLEHPRRKFLTTPEKWATCWRDFLPQTFTGDIYDPVTGDPTPEFARYAGLVKT